MAGRSRQTAASERPPRRPAAPPPDFRVELHGPTTPAEREEGWRRYVELVDWLIAQGALDA